MELRLKFPAPKRIVVYLAFVALLFAQQRVTAQEVKITLSGKSATYKELFSEIERQVGVWFAIVDNEFDTGRPVQLAAGEYTLKGVLGRLLASEGMSYRQEGKHMFIHATGKPMTGMRLVPESRIRSSVVGGQQEIDEHWQLVREGRDSTYKIIEQPQTTRLNYRTVAATDAPLAVTYKHPLLALKSNLLYGALTLTPNLAVEIGLGRRTTLELSGAYNPWKLKRSVDEEKKRVHTIVRPEFRYWLCERFNGHFFGGHLFYANYNVAGHKIPLLFEKEYRYEGWALGAGLSYGYHWTLHKNWGIEFNVGAGYAYMDYDRYSCIRCDRGKESKNKHYVGITRAGIALVYIIK